MSIPYRFMPWSRRGLARAHANADTANGPLATRPRITVGLTLQAQQDGANPTAVSGNIDLTLYGPSDVIGIDQRLIVRTDPRPNTTNFEPNYLPIVDFDPPDFPWLLTPARANDTGHLRPWLVLVVVERANVAPPALGAGRPLPSIIVPGTLIKTELPDLSESWLWAHTQAISTVAVTALPADQAAAAGTLSEQMKNSPERNISRLVCPRRLSPLTDYVACVVPATDGGRLRGLGQPVAGDTLAPAWTPQSANDLELPVYFSWTFSTGPVGDIETLARRLRTPSQYGGDGTFVEQLQHIGQRPVYVDADHLLFDLTKPGQTVFEGAMVSLNFNPEASNAVYSAKLQEILNSGSTRVADGTDPADHVPSLGPPIYGEYPAKRHTVDTKKIGQNWLDDLSLQPRYRLAAGWGAEIVRQNQDEFMQAAWEQLGDVLAAERAFSLARLARDVLKRVEVRHLARLSPYRVLAVMAPARARVAIAAGESLYGRMAGATLPQELFDGAMRRLTSPRRATLKMAQWRQHNLALPSITKQVGALVDNFANASARLAVIDPNLFVPDGILGSRSYDNVPLPANLETAVDMMPYTGLAFSLTGNQIKAIQGANAIAHKQAAVTKKRAPLMGDVWHKGLLTETHAIRLAELQSLAGAPLAGNIAQLIQQTSKRGTEGVLLAVQDGAVTSQALRIDGRSGLLKTVGSALIATRTKAMRAPRAARALMTAMATVPLTSLKHYGNSAVFATLPPSTLGGGGEVKIGLSGPGSFANVPQAAAGAVPSITMPPALKDRATLHRFSTAFKDFQRVMLPPADSLVIVQPVDFATAASAAQMRSRVDANRTVPARLASTLSLGGQAVTFAGGALSHPYISTSLDAASVDWLRYIVPHAFDRVMAFPRLLFPLSRKLETIAPDVFLPGVGVLPDDFVMAVQTNPRFIEALMVGANHEMGREMLWQGMPTDQRGTPFQHFWQRLDGNPDIACIHQWNAVPLGAQPGSTPMTVLLFRGQLLVRFPNLSIYAYKIKGNETRPGGAEPAPPGVEPEMNPDDMLVPVLRGNLGRDISYVGFHILPKEIGDYFFIVEEHMTEPRFGFDERVNGEQNSKLWQDVDWLDIGVKTPRYFGAKDLRLAQPALADPSRWADPHAATVADAALQRPFRGYWHGNALKTPGG
jgi:hypothetical protein